MSPNPKRRRSIVAGGTAAAVLLALVGLGLFLGPASGQETDDPDAPASADTGPVTDTVTIERDDLTESKDAVGTVGHGEPWAAPIGAEGVVTARHDKGTTVTPGSSLIWIDALPVVLADGEMPMYRTLELRRENGKLLNGPDVEQLQRFLISQGFDDNERLEADGVFGQGTQRAVKAWQKDVGRSATGSVDRSQLVFHPTALRIESTPQVGSSFAELSVTGADQRITAAFDTKSAGFLSVGADVLLQLDDQNELNGTIEDITTTVGDDGTRRLEVTLRPSTPLPSEIERVTVQVTRAVASDVLVVPVRAIVALAGGGYAVELDRPAGPTLTRVELGAVIDDRAEISGDFDEGDAVVVPTDVIGGGS